MNDQPSARLLLALVGERWDEADSLLGASDFDAAAFLVQCRESDIHPWVHHLLTRRQWLDRLGPAADELAALRKKVRHDNMLLLARAEQALDTLLKAGIVPVALKGFDLMHRVYDSFDQRTSDDVDLLLRVEDLRPALAALREGGWQIPDDARALHYIRSSHHLPMQSGGPIPVEFELHWNLAQEERYAIRPEELIERSVPLEVAGRTILRLCDNDLVAHLLVHHFSHYFDRRLKWLVDLNAIVRQPGFSWQTVVETMHRWKATAAAGSSLQHLHRMQPDLIPQEVLAALPFSAWRRALTLPLRSDHPLELFRNTRKRGVQLYLAAVMLERPGQLPAWLWHRSRRDQKSSENPLDPNSRADKETIL